MQTGLGVCVPTRAGLLKLVERGLPEEQVARHSGIANDAHSDRHHNLQHLGMDTPSATAFGNSTAKP